MTVASGNRPYRYLRAPFTLQDGELIGASGVLFEEPMFVVNAEKGVYAVVPSLEREFTKYINKGASVIASFEPKADGSNLDGTNADTPLTGIFAAPGAVEFQDYIEDIRGGISGLLENYVVLDVDYSGFQVVQDYFDANDFPTQHNWTHPASDSSSNGLGAASGALYDLDLREVQYQPYIRVGKFIDGSGDLELVMPIFPAFISTNGSMVNVLSRDLDYSKNIILSDELPGILGSGYEAANSDRFFVIGDVFVNGNSRIRIGYDLLDEGKLDSSATGTSQEVHSRTLEGELPSGMAEFSAPSLSLTSGIYGFQVFQNTDTNPTTPRSGLLGIWPPIENWRNQGFTAKAYKRTGTVSQRGSGIHVFNEGFWTVNTSGLILNSPINGQKLWHRFASQESYQTANMTSARSWSTDTPAADPGSSAEIIHVTTFNVPGTPVPFKDEYWVFATYNKRTGELVSSVEAGPFTNIDPASVGFNCPSLENHIPPSGESLSSWHLATAREGSDNFLRHTITDGTQIRGTIEPEPGEWGTATAAPEIIGTVGGELMANSRITPLEDPFRFYSIVINDSTGGSFPLPASSGTRQSGSMFVWDNYELMFEQELGHMFEPMTTANMTLLNNAILIQPQGDLDDGNDTAFLAFAAKLKGESTTTTWAGRVELKSSGVSDTILEITEVYGPFSNTPHFTDDFTS